jgi:hypothetical protein
MTMCKHRAVIGLVAVAPVLALAALSGCRVGDGGANDYERKQKTKENAAAALQGMGAKLSEQVFPQGRAWAIDFSGQQISDETVDHLKNMGYIVQLNLSKTNVTDAHMARVNEMGIGNLLLTLDLSHTAVSDAGLAKLDGLFLLTTLTLTGSKVTPAGVNRFRSERSANSKIDARFKSPNIKL